MELRRENSGWAYEDRRLQMKCGIPGEYRVKMLQTPDVPEIRDYGEVQRAVREPVSGKSLTEILRGKQVHTVAVLVSDATRAVPTAEIAGVIVDELTENHIALKDITFFVAIGVHRPATEAEFREILGNLYGKVKIENHTPFAENSLICLGDTKRGTPVYVNRRAYACDLHIQIGKVEPHEFAGFSGGRKSVLPGISGEKTIRMNHRPEMILHPGAGIGILKGNPVHEDMVEAAEMFGIDFSVNCVLNGQLRLAALYAGDLRASHGNAVRYVKEKLGVCFQKPDILITTPGLPLDIDFYQSVKALIALTEVLDETTTVILYCGCREGINSPDMLEAFRSHGELEKVVSYTQEHYKIQMDHVLLLSKIFRKNIRVITVCPNLKEEDIRTMFMTPGSSLQEALEEAVKMTEKKDPQILIYPRPQTGLPVLFSGGSEA